MTEDEEDVSVMWVCQGPPKCQLQGDEAIDAQMAGCVWCQRQHLIAGEWFVEQPASA